MTNLKVEVRTHRLNFIRPATTSRDTLRNKQVWYVKISNGDDQNHYGIGEIAPILGLSIESEKEIDYAISQMKSGELDPKAFSSTPSVRMGLETALADYVSTKDQTYFESTFANGLKGQLINGLIWMGDSGYMLEQITAKLTQGFSTIKLKIGTLDFESELDILRSIRTTYSAEEITIRVDANGAFGKDVESKLEQLAELDLHSIEQPIEAGNWQEMARLCTTSSLPIALDEELIGIHDSEQKKQLLEIISPQYIILKPSLLGGFDSCDEWIALAQAQGCQWWATSALESNLGLNAIAQWTATKNNPLPQGLGPGKLFRNNLPSRLELRGEKLFHQPETSIDFKSFWHGLDTV